MNRPSWFDETKKQLVLTALATPMVKYFNMWSSPMPGGVLAPMEYCYQGIEQARQLQGNDMVLGRSKAETNGLAGTSYYNGEAQYQKNDTDGNWAHWAGYAYSINQANLLLGYMPEKGTGSIIADGRTRALVIRAYSYMCMMEEYCQPYLSGGKEKLGLPIYRKYEPSQAPVARPAADSTWNLIISDLAEAAKLVDGNYTTGFSELEDFDAGVVNFLLARAYILTGHWNEAIAACDKIISSGKYSLIKADNYGCNPKGSLVFTPKMVVEPGSNAFTALKKNPECILGFIRKSSYNPSTQSDRAGVHTMLNNPFGTYSAGGSTTRIDDVLYKKIDENDVRKNAFYPSEFNFVFAGATKETVVPSYSAMKFGATCGIQEDGEKAAKQDEVEKQDFCKFRLAEVYLMKAEAQTYTGGDWKSTLNTLLAARAKDGKTLTCDNYASMAGMSPIQMVQLQWRIEMWGENGREYFNNKRWGINIDRSKSTLHWEKGLKTTWQEMTIPIPLRELETNPDCVQD